MQLRKIICKIDLKGFLDQLGGNYLWDEFKTLLSIQWDVDYVIIPKGELISKQNCGAVTSSKKLSWVVSFVFRKKLRHDNFVLRSTDL